MLDTDLDLLDTDIPSKHFVCLQNVLKTSSAKQLQSQSRHLFPCFLEVRLSCSISSKFTGKGFAEEDISDSYGHSVSKGMRYFQTRTLPQSSLLKKLQGQ